ncbi:hypothetical protein JTE90_027646 [Oedothorax gibbosus]|uniref:DUF4211 domain-containing protein n=1 Tax=Oedothorax gibbosus TaxID=931172 RepID=A0AAV6UT64_9ARAC|nr:hypothetical protein JTE90_027646 [Oedothorax gibbosus]
MNSSGWQPYSSGSTHLPSTSRQDTLNNVPTANSFLASSATYKDLQSPLSDPSVTELNNSCYEPISPAVLKEAAKYIPDEFFNGICKDSQSGVQSFLQCSGESRNEGSFPDSNNSYSAPSVGFNVSTIDRKPIGFDSTSIDQKPIGFNSTSIDQKPIVNQFNSSISTSFNSSSSVLDQPSSSPFGVLPHLVPPAKPSTVSRGSENFISPGSKTVPPYSNGPYAAAAENNGIMHNPLSNSSLSNDTATPSPAAINSLSSNFSSPSNDYANYSPQTMGAYNKSVHSPAPRSPSVAHQSYPSSPYTNMDSVGHISTVPPCSPLMNGGTYVNTTLKSVPNTIRNGLHKQPQMCNSSNSAISNNFSACCTPQSHIGPIPGLSKTPDYHNDYNMYIPDRVSPSSFSSGYTSMPSSRISNDSRLSLSPRGNANISHEAQMRFGHMRSGPSATAPSPTYQLNNVVTGQDMQYSPQKMKPPAYMPYQTTINSSNTCYGGQSRMMSNKVAADVDPYVYNSPEEDEKTAADIFNCEIDLTMSTSTPYSKYMDNKLPYRNNANSFSAMSRPNTTDSFFNRSLPQQSANNSLVQPPVYIKKEPMSTTEHQVPPMNNYYGSRDLGYTRSMSCDQPRKRAGRRGRRRAGGNIGTRGGRGRGRPVNEDKPVYFYDSSSRQGHNLQQQFKRDPDYTPVVNVSEQTRTVSIGNFSLPSSATFNWGAAGSGSSNASKAPGFKEGMTQIKQELSHYDIVMQVRPRRNLRSCSRGKGDNQFSCEFSVYVEKREDPTPGTVWPSKEEPQPEVPEEPEMPELKPQETPKKNKNSHPIKKESGLDDLKMKIVFDVETNKWCCERGKGTSESPLTLSSEDEDESTDNSLPTDFEPFNLLSGNQIKKEIYSDHESNQSDEETVPKVTNIDSATSKSNSKASCPKRHNPKPNLTSSCVSNSENFLAGQLKLKSEPLPPSPAQQKKELVENKNNSSPPHEIKDSNIEEAESASSNGQDLTTEKSEEMDQEKNKKLALRSSNKEPEPGPSTQLDSAEELDLADCSDSDTDPAWTPVGSNKSSDTNKGFGGPSGRKRGPKSSTGRKSTRGKKRKTSLSPTPVEPPVQTRTRKKNPPKPKKPTETKGKGGRKDNADRFLIAKADIDKPTPYIWKVDRKSSMLQRYELSLQNGVLLYHSSFTYAAGNQFCVNNYVEAKVKVLSPETVQYLGPNLSETAEVALSELKQEDEPKAKEETFEYLKEDFIVYVQSLLSQDVDSTFLEEIQKFKDDYFLVPIKNLETLSQVKKELLLNELWNEDIKKSIHYFPQVNILESGIDNIKCQACERGTSLKLLQFFGQAYDANTLAHVASPAPATTQFSVCDNCSISVSLYSRLHHYKYNLFVECHSKASQVKANNSDVQAPEEVLKVCLEDVKWINTIFAEAVKLWLDCKKEEEEDDS